MWCKRYLFNGKPWLMAGGLLVAGVWLSAASAQDNLPPPPPLPGGMNAEANDPNVEVLTRGPVHEAYARPVGAAEGGGLIVPKAPPAPVEEAPPEMKPQGEEAVWIPGYWSWDDDRKDFLWVSGVWRVPPPDNQWVSGYWQEAQNGYQWVSGFWTPASTENVAYLPTPPAALEQGPTAPAPDTNHFWVPGTWRWNDERYVWTTGYWAPAQPQWIWVPPTYAWTPHGWVFVPGYWDYDLSRRGLLFSPVYFHHHVAFYRPGVCVSVGALTFSLFSRPSYCHYYFGDYYDPMYFGLGIRPWFNYGYDPMYTYYKWHYHTHGDPLWDKHLHGWYDYYRAKPEMRPPHTLIAQQKLLASPMAHSRPDFHQLSFVASLNTMHHDPHAFVRLEPLSKTQQALVAQSIKQSHEFRDSRRLAEAKPFVAGQVPGAGGPKAESLNLKKMPNFQATQLPAGKAVGTGPGARFDAGAKLVPGVTKPSLPAAEMRLRGDKADFRQKTDTLPGGAGAAAKVLDSQGPKVSGRDVKVDSLSAPKTVNPNLIQPSNPQPVPRTLPTPPPTRTTRESSGGGSGGGGNAGGGSGSGGGSSRGRGDSNDRRDKRGN